MSRTPPTNIIEQLRMDEGQVLHAYRDSLGFLTIGIGRLIDERKGGGITSEEASYLLSNDVKKITDQLDERLPWWRELDAPRRGVLMNMAFQLGINGLLGFKTTLAMIKDRRFSDAPRQMLRSKWASQTPERAHRLAEQMCFGVWK